MKKTLLILLSTAWLLAAGCNTTGLSPRETGVVNYNKMVYTLSSQFDESKTGTGELKLPIRLGIAQIGEIAPNDTALDTLEEQTDLFLEVVAIPLSINGNNSRWRNYGPENNDAKPAYEQCARELKTLGKQLGVSHILVIGGNIDSRSTASPLQLLNLLIIPGFLIPSNTIFLEARASGALIETESGRVRHLLTTTGENKGRSPTFYLDQKTTELSVEMRDTLSIQIVSELVDKLRK